MQPREQVVPQPPQVRPPNPGSTDGFAANPTLLTAQQHEAVTEREYPKMMYCDGEEPLRVETRSIEETLGSGWRETPEDPNKAPDPVAVPATREEYYKLNQSDVLSLIKQTTDDVELQRLRTSEIANPRRPNGRPAVLEALTAALTPLEPQSEDSAPKVDPGLSVDLAPAVSDVDESELEPIEPPPPNKATRGRKSK